MGLDYLMVHLTYNIPLAVVMTLAYWPFFTKLELYRIATLITIAVISTIPWDSYLIRARIWTYPPYAILGPRICLIPIEEVFFFVIQTYNTSLAYIILTKRFVMPMYLGPQDALKRNLGIVIIGSCQFLGLASIFQGGRYTYLGLILAWICPFMMMQWLVAYRFIVRLPLREVSLAVCIPTLLLWVVDTIALGKGTWVIESATKLDIQLWGSRTEAIFFVVTNIMIVLGQMAIDNAIALGIYNMGITSETEFPSYGQLFTQFITRRNEELNMKYIHDLRDAVMRLKQRSQSMYMGSAMFEGQLRIDLIYLYSFCRVIDDLVDEAPDSSTARSVIQECALLLEQRFAGKDMEKSIRSDPVLLSSIEHLPVERLSIEPLQNLLKGFETDLEFNTSHTKSPILTETDLERYAYRVAGTVAESVIQLTIAHDRPQNLDKHTHQQTITAGALMGQALQYINIARDIQRDAEIGRVYIPTTWLEAKGLTPAKVLDCPTDPQIQSLRMRLLDQADEWYRMTEAAIGRLPLEAQGPIRVTVESYMEIGRSLRQLNDLRTKGKMEVPLWRRLKVAYGALAGGM
ncbi:phytoene synthase [Aspergillus piperis CBS 112811]|uniref:Bifunctional lycopene cyclase/phytoene synthase n=1 Tax=Aspergillus piperis CBS 112811 TaxID=1448313 RepID=A0A8G1R6J2_9EURO|nr:phytoene synthase [Aspergillus piperis CBS 112811]RAH60213.1 phytoene synthase [Aspergillus piperis CBS 112811]